MDFRLNERRYQEAGLLYARGRYEDALEILDGLCRQYPDTPPLLYARARCLAKMRRIPDAVAVCDALIRRFNHPQARALKEHLIDRVSSALATPTPFSGPEGLNPDLNVQVVPTPFRTPPPASGPVAAAHGAATIQWRTALLLMAGTAAAAAALGFAWARGYLPFP